MKKVVKKTFKNTIKNNSKSKTLLKKGDFVTNDVFKKDMNRIDKRFEAVDKRFEAVDKRFDAIDKRFEDQTNTLISAIESVMEVVHRIEVNQEKDREEAKVFREMAIGHDNKIKDLDNRVVKIERKVF